MKNYRDQFKVQLKILFDKGVSPVDVSKGLMDVGVFFDVVHNKVRYHKNREQAGIPTPAQKP